MGLISFVLIPSCHHLLQSVGESLKLPTALDWCRSKCHSSLIQGGIVIVVLRSSYVTHLLGLRAHCQRTLFFTLSLPFLCRLWLRQKAIFSFLRPGQLQSDTTRVQIVHSFQTQAHFAIILLALYALWIRRWDGADSGGKWNAIIWCRK